MHPRLQALLTLQAHDDEISRIEARVAAVGPREAALVAGRSAAERGLAAANAAVEREEQRQRELGSRADDLRRLNARAVSQMDQVRKVHEANAATAQIDITRRALGEVEAEMQTLAERIGGLRGAAAGAAATLASLDESQASERQAIAAARGELASSLADARARRQTAAADVEPSTLTRYDRVRIRRRATSVYPLRGLSCSNCDTAVPTQRRLALAVGGTVDICESCGVLLYGDAREP